MQHKNLIEDISSSRRTHSRRLVQPTRRSYSVPEKPQVSNHVKPVQLQAAPKLKNADFSPRAEEHNQSTAKRSNKLRHKIKDFINPAKQNKLIFAAAALVFSIGIFTSISALYTNKKVGAQVEEAQSSSVSNPEEAPPDESEPSEDSINNYRVDASLPRIIKIPKFNVKGAIKPVGLTKNGAVAVPSSIYSVGWFSGSAKPGTGGTTLLVGHVHGPTKPGIFNKLSKLVAGDELLVEKGDGTTISYRVVRLEAYKSDSVDMAAAITPVTFGKEGLNLITCSGRLIENSTQYDERTIVYAERSP